MTGTPLDQEALKKTGWRTLASINNKQYLMIIVYSSIVSLQYLFPFYFSEQNIQLNMF